MTYDNDRFLELMQEQKVRARAARANISGWANASGSMLADLPKTEFVGYTEQVCDAKVLAIIVDEGLVDEVSEGEFTLILDKTVCYGEGGGQVGDDGSVFGPDTMALILDTKKSDGIYLHLCNANAGIIRVGDTLKVQYNSERRQSIMRNHSAAHLLQNALRQVLGTHVEQAGSYVSDTVCRFDFTHFAAMTAEEISKVEAIVNTEILAAGEGSMTEMGIDEAKALGAMALFGEKYGKTVRVVRMGSSSIELCGGTHVDNTGKIGLFKIISESSVAAGVRRIEAVTGTGVLALLGQKDALIHSTAKELKVNNPADIAHKATQLQSELNAAHKEIESLNGKIAASQVSDLIKNAVSVGDFKLVTVHMPGLAVDIARSMTDKIKDTYADVVAVIAISDGESVKFLSCAGKDAVAHGAHAGKLVGAVAAVTGGKGGGRPDSAMAGGKEFSKLNEALASASATLASMLK